MKTDELKPGEGRVAEVDGELVAIYNKDGVIEAHRTECTHLACDVDWNSREKTWDCPCHGSRFSADGAPVRGPAKRPLLPKEIELRDGEIHLKK